jgi:hypothetical protein
MTNREIWEEIERLKATAIRKAEAAHEDILSKKYEWELGADICEMIGGNFRAYIKENDLKNLTLMCYPVRINYESKTIIKLWKEVEE